MSTARAWIAIPLPPPSDWVLLRTPNDLPDGYTILGSLAVGRSDPPALSSNAATGLLARRLAQALRASIEGHHDQWEALYALYCKMSEEQRRRLIEYGSGMLQAEPSLSAEAP